MIVKKVRNPFKSSSKAVRIHRLADYIDRPENPSPAAPANGLRNGTAGRMAEWADEAQRPFVGPTQEKCIYAGTRGFFTPDRADQKAEMRALAQQAVRSKDPISHYVLSWRAGEQPTPTQIEEAVDLFLDELGLSAHQVFYGLHVDTAHVHLHLMINRVHPETRTLRLPNKGGRDLEAAHRAVARIEHAHGWQREEHGRYRVQVNGEVRREGSTEPRKVRVPRALPNRRCGRARLMALDHEAPPTALQAHDIPAFIAIVYSRRVDYRRQDAANGLPGFVDRGREIVVFAETDRDTVLAALQLATQKWGAFQIEGDAAYQARCVRLAAEYGLPLRSPDQPAALPPTGDRLGPEVSRPGPDAPLP
jgi:hypothetical protein